MYIEVSYPRIPLDKAWLISLMSIIPTENQSHSCLNFFYHMYGDSIGSLTVQLHNINSSNIKNIWTLSGNKGNSWKFASVPLIFGQEYKVRVTEI